jgi:hypothetical protein
MALELHIAMLLSLPGPHIILFMTRIGSLSSKDTESLALYKKFFGEDIEKYMIVVFTGKEILMEVGINIHDYVQSLRPESDLKQLLRRCNNRYVAFSDTGDVSDQEKNVEKLLDIAGRLALQRLARPYFSSDIYESYVKVYHLSHKTEDGKEDDDKIVNHEKMKYADT